MASGEPPISPRLTVACGLLLALLLAVQFNNAEETCFDVSKHPNLARLARRKACGVSKALKSNLMDRIMGGTNAELGEFPWMARLFYRTKKDIDPRCGGSLIHEQYVLTAAHCCNGDYSMELLFVRLGEYDTLNDEDCYKGRCAPKHKDIAVDEIYSHTGYNPSSMANDICIVRLARKVKFSDYIYPICLPVDCKMQEKHFNHNKVIAAGWGLKDERYDRPIDILQKVTLSTVSTKTCEKMWAKEDAGTEVGDTQICAGRVVGQDVCGGDSGGPLMYKSDISGVSRQYAVGLVSYGQPCSHRENTLAPGVYTKVAAYLPWIFNIIG